MTDHDAQFKKILENFFPEFVELFVPGITQYWKSDSITFLQQEIFVDIKTGEKKIIDLLAQVPLIDGENNLFIIHIEHQSSNEANFHQRMYNYFSYLHKKYQIPIYPIVIFSHDYPQQEGTNSYEVGFPDFKVLEFNYRTIQLNRLDWREYANLSNPVASAFMSRMRMEDSERPIVKLKALQLLASLRLNPAQVELISGFIDTYLDLNPQEQKVFNQEIATIEPTQEREVMKIVTSWMREGIEIMVMRQLNRRFGQLSPQQEEKIKGLTTSQLQDLGEALLDFTTIADLEAWLSFLDQPPF